nr:MAG TPA: hypothetical protein [Bacteriophage sp.]
MALNIKETINLRKRGIRMAKISVVTPTNLGDGIKKNIETKKFDVAVDNQTIKINPEGI